MGFKCILIEKWKEVSRIGTYTWELCQYEGLTEVEWGEEDSRRPVNARQ